MGKPTGKLEKCWTIELPMNFSAAYGIPALAPAS
jgi:hypothetical protein